MKNKFSSSWWKNLKSEFSSKIIFKNVKFHQKIKILKSKKFSNSQILVNISEILKSEKLQKLSKLIKNLKKLSKYYKKTVGF